MTVGHVTSLLTDKNHMRLNAKLTVIEHMPDLFMGKCVCVCVCVSFVETSLNTCQICSWVSVCVCVCVCMCILCGDIIEHMPDLFMGKCVCVCVCVCVYPLWRHH